MARTEPAMTLSKKPFSQACENNKQPILEVLHRILADRKKLLEIGSGTGQHAAPTYVIYNRC